MAKWKSSAIRGYRRAERSAEKWRDERQEKLEAEVLRQRLLREFGRLDCQIQKLRKKYGPEVKMRSEYTSLRRKYADMKSKLRGKA